MSETYPIVEVRPSELHSSAYQPSSRTESNTALVALQKSIRDEGLQYPPLVVTRPQGDGYTIIDGHRRVRVVTDLKWPKIPVIVSTQGDARKLFAAVSGASKPLTATEWVQVYLGGGDLPPGPNTSCIKRLDDVMGREFLIDLANSRLSPQVWNSSAKVIKYLGLTEDERPAILRWIVKHRISRQLSAAMQANKSRESLIESFRGDIGTGI